MRAFVEDIDKQSVALYEGVYSAWTEEDKRLYQSRIAEWELVHSRTGELRMKHDSGAIYDYTMPGSDKDYSNVKTAQAELVKAEHIYSYIEQGMDVQDAAIQYLKEHLSYLDLRTSFRNKSVLTIPTNDPGFADFIKKHSKVVPTSAKKRTLNMWESLSETQEWQQIARDRNFNAKQKTASDYYKIWKSILSEQDKETIRGTKWYQTTKKVNLTLRKTGDKEYLESLLEELESYR